MAFETYWARYLQRRSELVFTADQIETTMISKLGGSRLGLEAIWETEWTVDLRPGEQNRCLLTWENRSWLEGITTIFELTNNSLIDVVPDAVVSVDPLDARREQIQMEHTFGLRTSLLLREMADRPGFVSGMHILGGMGHEYLSSFLRAMSSGIWHPEWARLTGFDPGDEDLTDYLACLVKHGFI